jgi:hypothetical protein
MDFGQKYLIIHFLSLFEKWGKFGEAYNKKTTL